MSDSLLAAAKPLPRTLFGYEVLGRLGRGAGSLVYAVCHPSSRQLFALKLVQRQSPEDERFMDQLTNEYAVSRHFQYPGLRRCSLLRLKRGWGLKVVEAALMMDFIDGESLDGQPTLPLGDLLETLIQAGKAFHVLHGSGFVHCDIKPGNIMRTKDGQTKVIDFGQTCRTGTAKERIQGTPDYIALEQIRRLPVTAQTDVYSLGATMYWLLTGQYVPTAATAASRDPSLLLRQNYPTPRQLRPTVPEGWSELIMHCLRLEPGDRPREMGHVVEMLSRQRTLLETQNAER